MMHEASSSLEKHTSLSPPGMELLNREKRGSESLTEGESSWTPCLCHVEAFHSFRCRDDVILTQKVLEAAVLSRLFS